MTRDEKRLALARAWLEKATADLAAARDLVKNPAIPSWVSGFHLQQALEKTWKGRLVVLGVRPPNVHDLSALLALRSEGRTPSERDAALIVGLQHFAVEDRYPLLTPSDVPIESILALVPEVEAEVAALRSEIALQSGT